ncbi:hypothetical protein HK102_012898, partial [Quaeritorhiza haematococci]
SCCATRDEGDEQANDPRPKSLPSQTRIRTEKLCIRAKTRSGRQRRQIHSPQRPAPE